MGREEKKEKKIPSGPNGQLSKSTRIPNQRSVMVDTGARLPAPGFPALHLVVRLPRCLFEIAPLKGVPL